MRILANYGSRNNGSSYNVTFEQTGDVPMDRAEETIDLLFKLAREAVQRQIEGDLEFPPKEEITIPRPRSSNNGNSKSQLRNPEAPATKKQRRFLDKIAKEKGVFIEGLDSFTMAEASQRIKELIGA